MFWQGRLAAALNSVSYCGNDCFQLLFCQFGINRKSQAFLGSSLADWKVSFVIFEVSKTLLKMHWEGIVDLSSNFPVSEMSHQLVPLGAAYDELIVHVPSVRNFVR